ncbi:MAG: O-antigen translocase [Burkholderiaceae bacterium]|nr:O-antigen translocase [Burkholderiaceae bacterium]
MSDEGKSYRQILRSTSIIGGASVINILIGLVRVKAAAVLLGPTGVGWIGLFSNLMATAANVAALGMGTVGTRQIATANSQEDQQAVAVARRSLFWGTLAMAVIGALVFWLLRGILATHVLADSALSNEVGWLALGVGLTVAGGSQGALLNGLRRIGDLARISVYSAVLSTTLGVGALLLWHERGLLVYLLLTPVASFVVGHWYVARLPRVQAPPTPMRELTQQWGSLARLGVAFMLAGLAGTLGQLVVRTLVQRELGTEALGLFEASWVISMTYIGFVLRAMGTDYYPRLTAVIHDHAAVNKLVNEQTEVALLLAGPVFLAMLGLAPWVIELLYSSKFAVAAAVLRWQILGDILKVISWPLGFVILAAGRGRIFMFVETLAIVAFVLCVWLGLPYLGLTATGVGFLVMYIVYLPVVYWLARRSTGFHWARNVLLNALLLMIVGVLVAIVAAVHNWAGAALGITAATLFGFYALQRLAHMTALPGLLAGLVPVYRKIAKLFR